MDILEANKIYNNWRQWYWPCHFILHSIFLSSIPESFLPYPVDVLEEALNIVAKSYWGEGDRKYSDTIKQSIGSLLYYKKDEEALQNASENFSSPKMREVMLIYIANYKKDWISWLGKQEK
jgi:hypothetical protein